jgi:hypothetical protein
MTIRPLLAGAAVIAAAVAAIAAGTPAAADDAGTQPTISAHVDQTLTQWFEHYGDTGGGWTGADSAYSVPLPGGTDAWIYSDTFLGTVNADHSRPMDAPFIHNSIIAARKGTLSTVTGGTAVAPESLFKVAGGDEGSDWYWAGDGTVEGDHLRVMLLEFVKTGNDVFDFAFRGSAIASLDVHTLKLESITTLPEGDVEWGSAILEDGGYTYVYGVEDLSSTKYLHLARVRTNQLTDASAWRFWTGSAWSADQTDSARMMSGVANEFSVTKFEGEYTLVTGDTSEILSPHIVMYRSDSPTGPFTDKTLLYTTPETAGNVFTYNAKAHPEYGSDDTLMISYNVNSFDTNDVYANVDNYRPRYVDVTVTPAE